MWNEFSLNCVEQGKLSSSCDDRELDGDSSSEQERGHCSSCHMPQQRGGTEGQPLLDYCCLEKVSGSDESSEAAVRMENSRLGAFQVESASCQTAGEVRVLGS